MRQTVTVHLSDDESVEIRLDRDSGVSLQAQLFEQLKHYIGTRRIRQGQMLPSVRKLAHLLTVSPVTVFRTYAELQARGLVEARHGSGVFVVDFAALADARTPAGGRLHDFAAAVVEQALRVGHDPAELADVIRAIAERRVARDAHLVVVIDEFDSVDPQVEQLGAALADDDIRVLGVRLDQVEASRDLIERAGVIASAPHCFGLVRRRLPDREDDVVGLTMVLAGEVNQQLRRLDPRSRVVVVGTHPSFLSWMTYLIRLQVLVYVDPIEVAMTDESAVKTALLGADAVVYGSGVRHRLPPLIPEGTPAIELRHVPDAESISNLRAQLRRVAERQGTPETASA